MATNHVQRGTHLTLPAPAGGVVSGSGYLIGAIFGVAQVSAAAGEDVTFAVTEVWDLPKVAGTAFAIGDVLYWDATAGNLTKTSSGNTKVGAAVAAAGSAATVGRVRLNGTV